MYDPTKEPCQSLSDQLEVNIYLIKAKKSFKTKKSKQKSLTDLQGNTYRIRKQSLSLCRLKRYLNKKGYYISKKRL